MSEQPTSIRFPAELRQRIAERAAAERRSLSGQVLHLLDEALGPEPPREPEGPLAGERLGARRLVLDLHERGLDPDRIAAVTGLDPCLALRWSEIDFGRRRVLVRRRLRNGSFGKPKSRYGRRDVPLSTAMAQRLWAARAERKAADDEPVFAAGNGAHLDAANLFGRMFKPACRRARCPVGGLPRAAAHVRDDALSARPERQAGADVARPSLARVHARHVRAPARGRPPGRRPVRGSGRAGRGRRGRGRGERCPGSKPRGIRGTLAR